jgi:hypothetical protein
MLQVRLNSSMLLTVEREMAKNVNRNDIIDLT